MAHCSSSAPLTYAHFRFSFLPCRFANINTMGPVGRGNALEYCIHGHFQRTEGDKNGTHGACWVPLARIFDSMAEADDDFAENLTLDAVMAKIKMLERRHVGMRTEIQAQYWNNVPDDAGA